MTFQINSYSSSIVINKTRITYQQDECYVVPPI